ncbi:MAG: 4-hydroxy-tetrahydrodipicolinate reductase, partial [Oscillospiraceae bacterium]
MIKIIICGILGNMGSRLLETCFNDNGVNVVAGVDKRGGVLSNIPLFESFTDCNVSADVVIDFSNPALTAEVIAFCKSSKTALVMCTTGQDKEQLASIEELSKHVPVFKSANMSLGIALLSSLAKKAALLLGDDFDIEITEKENVTPIE